MASRRESAARVLCFFERFERANERKVCGRRRNTFGVRLRERKSAVKAARRADKKIGGAAEAAAAFEGVRQSKRRRGTIAAY